MIHEEGRCSLCGKAIPSTPAQSPWGKRWGFYCNSCRVIRGQAIAAHKAIRAKKALAVKEQKRRAGGAERATITGKPLPGRLVDEPWENDLCVVE